MLTSAPPSAEPYGTTTRKPRYAWMDLLRAMATFHVVLLHVAAGVEAASPHNTPWYIAVFYNSTVRYSVPVFLMMTGALLLPTEYPLREFLSKRLMRILLPFAFWSGIYILHDLAIRLYYTHTTVLATTLWLGDKIRNGAAPHLWYVYMLTGIYLFLPIVAAWLRNTRPASILYFLGIWVLTLFINQPYLAPMRLSVDLSYFSGYLGYVLLGYYLHAFSAVEDRTSRYAVMAAGGILVTFAGTVLSSPADATYQGFYDNLTPNVMLASMGIFQLSRTIRVPASLSRWLSQMNRYSFGIYLAHCLVLTYFLRYGVSPDRVTPLIGIPGVALLTFAVTLVLVCGVARLPYGRSVAGVH